MRSIERLINAERLSFNEACCLLSGIQRGKVEMAEGWQYHDGQIESCLSTMSDEQCLSLVKEKAKAGSVVHKAAIHLLTLARMSS